jgi:hypothetical protein
VPIGGDRRGLDASRENRRARLDREAREDADARDRELRRRHLDASLTDPTIILRGETRTTLPTVDTSGAALVAASGPSDLLLYVAGGALLLVVLFSLKR